MSINEVKVTDETATEPGAGVVHKLAGNVTKCGKTATGWPRGITSLQAAGLVATCKECDSEVDNEPGGVLALLLGAIHQHDIAPGGPNYEARNRMILFAIGAAVTEGVPVGFRQDRNEPAWPVVYFELPTGQVSWHLPQHPRPWDGHDTRTKYERIRAFQERGGHVS